MAVTWSLLVALALGCTVPTVPLVMLASIRLFRVHMHMNANLERGGHMRRHDCTGYDGDGGGVARIRRRSISGGTHTLCCSSSRACLI